MSSQDSEVNSQEMAEMEELVRPQSTTIVPIGVLLLYYYYAKFEAWCLKRNLNVDLKTVEEETLADNLRRFYAEVKTNKGLQLSPSGMVGVRAAIHRRIIQAPISRKLNILTNPSFVIANNMVDTKIKLFRKTQCKTET